MLCFKETTGIWQSVKDITEVWQEAKQRAGNDDMIYMIYNLHTFAVWCRIFFLIMLYDVADRVSGAKVVPRRGMRRSPFPPIARRLV